MWTCWKSGLPGLCCYSTVKWHKSDVVWFKFVRQENASLSHSCLLWVHILHIDSFTTYNAISDVKCSGYYDKCQMVPIEYFAGHTNILIKSCHLLHLWDWWRYRFRSWYSSTDKMTLFSIRLRFPLDDSRPWFHVRLRLLGGDDHWHLFIQVRTSYHALASYRALAQATADCSRKQAMANGCQMI